MVGKNKNFSDQSKAVITFLQSSKKIIISASIISLILCVIGTGIITYNANNEQVMSLHTLGSSMIYTSIILFAQFIIGSLVIDLFNAIINNNDD